MVGLDPHVGAVALLQGIGILGDLEDVPAVQIALMHLAQGHADPRQLDLNQRLKFLLLATNTRRPSVDTEMCTVGCTTRAGLDQLDCLVGIPHRVASDTLGVKESLKPLALRVKSGSF